MLIHQHFGKLPLDPDRCGILAYRIGSDDDLLYIFEGWCLKHGSHQEIIQDGTQSASAGFLLDRAVLFCSFSAGDPKSCS